MVKHDDNGLLVNDKWLLMKMDENHYEKMIINGWLMINGCFFSADIYIYIYSIHTGIMMGSNNVG